MWIQISSGRGPDECELAVGNLLNTLLKENGNIKVVDAVPGNIPGNFKSALLSVEDQLKGDLGNFNGSILWICKSPYRQFHKRKNWFINVEQFDEEEKLGFSEHDIKIEAMRSSGPGGQNVNKVETAVRATYLPMKISVVAREERSQYRNKKLAIARLAKIITQRNHEGSLNQKKSMWNQHNELERGNPVRVYEGGNFSRKE
jgi:peptide chain release factor